MLFYAILEQLGDAERLFVEKIFNDYGKQTKEEAGKTSWKSGIMSNNSWKNVLKEKIARIKEEELKFYP